MAGLISRFLGNRNGNFAMMTAVAFPAIIAAVAFAVDITNTLTTKTEMQDANDAAVLSAARYFKENRVQPTLATVQDFLDANSSIKITIKKLNFNPGKSEFTLETESTVKTLFMGYFGQGDRTYNALSKASLGFSQTLEFALALDTTGSMSVDGKMGGLKAAASDFIDVMFDAKDKGAEIKGGIVPFAQYVNVGTSNRGKSWLNVPADVDTRVTKKECRMEKPVIGTENCRSVFTPAYTIDHPAVEESCVTIDGAKSCTPASPAWIENVAAGNYNQCDYIYGAEKEICEMVTTGDFVTWQGCVGSRDYPLNVQDSSYSNRIPGLNGVVCSTPLQTLTDKRSVLEDTIAGLTPSGETYMPEGVMWGTRVLTKQAPFTEAAVTGKGGSPVRKALVVMTDGMNTLSPDGAYHTNTDTDQANDYTAQACNEAKAQDLEIFTISFGNSVPGSVKDMLEACASIPANYFNAKDAADLKQAFKGIANELLSVRLTQ
jgi:Flp pilus assembly protein TadG